MFVICLMFAISFRLFIDAGKVRLILSLLPSNIISQLTSVTRSLTSYMLLRPIHEL